MTVVTFRGRLTQAVVLRSRKSIVTRNTILGQQSNIICRQFSVKELPWCASSDSPVRRQAQSLHPQQHKKTDSNGCTREELEGDHDFQPIEKFGIVAAMASDSRVIGVNGRLPWRSETDRKLFTNLTQDRILIVGRKTLQDECSNSLDHVRHAKHCIVVSTTVSNGKELWSSAANKQGQLDPDWRMLRIARSLEEALHVANLLQRDTNDNFEMNPPDPSISKLKCWVGGGERLFEEALKHKSAAELHLSIVNVNVDISNFPIENVARFPAKYRWDHNFQLISSTVFDESLRKVELGEPMFTQHVFKRIERSMPKRPD